MSAAVVLMAYGSPERLEDVPDYYADIRGGRPIKPENLAGSRHPLPTARHRGVEPAERDHRGDARARSSSRSGCRSHRDEALARRRSPRQPSARSQAGATRSSGSCSRRTTRALSIAGYRDQLEAALDGRAAAAFRRELVRRRRASRVCSPSASAAPTRTWSSPPTRCPLASSTRATPTATSCSRRRGSSPRAAGIDDWSFSFQSESPTGEPWLGPDILDHLTELHAQGHDDVLVCPVGFVSDHLEIRWDIDTEAQERAAELGMGLEPDRDAERRARLRRGARRRSCAARSLPVAASARTPMHRADRRRPRLAALPRLRARPTGRSRTSSSSAAGGAVSEVWALRDVSLRSSPARRSGSSAATARARRRCCRLVSGHLPADLGPRRSRRADRLAARARRRLPPRLHRARERLPERLDPRPLARAHPRADGRDRRVRRARAVHRPARAHLLLRDVHAARLLGRRAHPGRRAAPRRGLRRRRRGLPAQVLRQDPRVQGARRHDRLRLPRRAGGRAALRPRGAAAPGRGRLRRRDARGDRASTGGCSPTSGAPTSSRPGCASGGAARRGSSRPGCSTPTATSAASSRRASRLAVELVVASEPGVPPPRRLARAARQRRRRARRRHRRRPTSSAGTRRRASASCASRSTACRSPRAASTSAARSSRPTASGSCTRSTTRVRFFVFPPAARPARCCSTAAGAMQENARLRANRRADELAHLPRLAAADGARARPPVQALHAARGAAAGRRARLARSGRLRRGRDLLRPREPRLQRRAHRARASPRPSAPRTGSTCASGPSRSPGADAALSCGARSATRHGGALVSLSGCRRSSSPSAALKGKSRLGLLPAEARAALAARDARRRRRGLRCGRADLRRRAGRGRARAARRSVADPGGGQGAAVRAGLDAAAPPARPRPVPRRQRRPRPA